MYYLIYYLTLGTLYHLQLRFRVICQHIFLNKENKIQYNLTTSRTIKGGLLEKIFFTSDITAYHNLHHDFPQYPFRKLKKLTLDNTIIMGRKTHESIGKILKGRINIVLSKNPSFKKKDSCIFNIS